MARFLFTMLAVNDLGLPTRMLPQVRQVLRAPGYRKSAQRVAESMRAYGGAVAAADLIERFARR